MTEHTNTNHGGARVGAGRKQGSTLAADRAAVLGDMEPIGSKPAEDRPSDGVPCWFDGPAGPVWGCWRGAYFVTKLPQSSWPNRETADEHVARTIGESPRVLAKRAAAAKAGS